MALNHWQAFWKLRLFCLRLITLVGFKSLNSKAFPMQQTRKSQIHFKLLALLLISGVTTIKMKAAFAQIVPDNTLGAESSRVTPDANLRGLPTTLIQGGATRGANLFQSFSQFNVGNGQRVYFANPQGIENILSRVTGGDVSRIFGTLGVEGRANLFFLNPNGIIFGPNARLDIAGSFFASTANSFVFDNNLKFSATNPEAPPLLTVTFKPGLQFNTNQSASITSTGNLSVGQDLTLAGVNLDLEGKLQANNLTLQAVDTLKIRDSVANPFIANSGGKLVMIGDRAIDIFALNHPQSGFFSGGDMVLQSANTVAGDARYSAGGNFQIQQLDGKPGNFFSPNDPVVLANGNVTLGNYTGASLHVLAGGSVTLGDVTITGTDDQANTINSISTPNLATVTLWDGTSLTINGCCQPTLDVRAGIDWSRLPVDRNGIDYGYDYEINNQPVFDSAVTAANILVGNVSTSNLQDSLIFLTNRFNRNLALPNGVITAGNINGSVFNGNGGNVIIDALGDIKTANINTFVGVGGEGTAGNIRLLSEKGGINTTNGTLNASAGNGFGGFITLTSDRDISTAEIRTFSFGDPSTGVSRNINITSNNGFIDTTAGTLISSTDNGFAGNITLKAAGNVSIGDIDSFSNRNGKAGNVNITSGGQFSLVGGRISTRTSGSQQKGGDITIEAQRVNIQDSEIVSNSNNNNTSDFAVINILATQGSAVFNQSRLNTSNSGSGLAGDINISASDEVSIRNDSNNNSENRRNNGIFSNGDSGRIFIGASNFTPISPKKITIDNSVLSTTASVSSQQNQGSTISAGDINIRGGSLFLNNGSQINTFVDSSDTRSNPARVQAGNVNINVGNGDIAINAKPNDSGISGIFSTLGNGAETGRSDAIGAGGNIFIKSGSLSINGTPNSAGRANAGIAAKTFGFGDAGSITIETGSLSISNGGFLDNGTTRQGNAGPIKVTADQIKLENENINRRAIQSVVQLGSEKGNGGDITIDTRTLSLRNASITASTAGNGDGGNVSIKASDSVTLGGNPNGFSSGLLSLTTKEASGRAGNISVTTDKFQVADGAIVAAGTSNNGRGGDITIKANSFDASNGGQVLTNTRGSGDAGDITFILKDSLTLDGSDFRFGDRLNTAARQSSDQVSDRLINYSFDNSVSPSGVFANTESGSTGKGGRISIDPNQVTIQNGAKISANTSGSGDAGSIDLTANRLTLNNGEITAQTIATGKGGDITLNVRDFLELRRGSQISTTASVPGSVAGNITINSPNGFIFASPGENNDIITNALNGTAGKINITAKGIFGLQPLSEQQLRRQDPRQQNPRNLRSSDISPLSAADFPFNDVVDDNFDANPDANLVSLPTNPVDRSRVIAQGCGAFDSDRSSQFINTGRGGLPPTPEQILNGDVLWDDIRIRAIAPQQSPKNTSPPTSSKPNQTLVPPATNWVFNNHGEVTLVSSI